MNLRLLSISVFSFLLSAFASAQVVVTSLSDVTVNGKQSLDIINQAAIANNNAERDALRTAVLAYESALKAAQEAAQQEIAKAAKLRAACEQALAAGDLDTLKSLLQPAVDEAKQTEKERRLAELTKQRDELQRQIDEASALDVPAEPAPPIRAAAAAKPAVRASKR